MAEKDRSKVSLADFALRSKGAQEERFANTMKATESWAYGKIVDAIVSSPAQLGIKPSRVQLPDGSLGPIYSSHDIKNSVTRSQGRSSSPVAGGRPPPSFESLMASPSKSIPQLDGSRSPRPSPHFPSFSSARLEYQQRGAGSSGDSPASQVLVPGTPERERQRVGSPSYSEVSPSFAPASPDVIKDSFTSTSPAAAPVSPVFPGNGEGIQESDYEPILSDHEELGEGISKADYVHNYLCDIIHEIPTMMDHSEKEQFIATLQVTAPRIFIEHHSDYCRFVSGDLDIDEKRTFEVVYGLRKFSFTGRVLGFYMYHTATHTSGKPLKGIDSDSDADFIIRYQRVIVFINPISPLERSKQPTVEEEFRQRWAEEYTPEEIEKGTLDVRIWRVTARGDKEKNTVANPDEAPFSNFTDKELEEMGFVLGEEGGDEEEVDEPRPELMVLLREHQEIENQGVVMDNEHNN